LIPDSEVCTRLVKWEKVPKLAEAQAEAGFDLDLNSPWSSVNNCTEGGARRRLKLELQSRGFDDSEENLNILMRGGGLAYGRTSLIYRSGQLQERQSRPEEVIWPGWS